MKVAICDDSLTDILVVEKQLDAYAKENDIKIERYSFLASEEVLHSKIAFDLAILDICMERINGIELGRALKAIHPNILIIYVTAHPDYLDEAFSLNAVRLLPKPLNEKRFWKGLEDAVKRYDEMTQEFYLRDGQTLRRLYKRDVIYIEIENRKTKVVTAKGTYTSSCPMKYWREYLTTANFMSPHNSYIINTDYVTLYERNRYFILNGKYEISIARTRSSEIHRAFTKQIALR